MAGTSTPIFPQTLVNSVVLINNATGNGIANVVTIRVGSTNGDKIESIAVTSTDTSDRVLTLVMTVSATDYRLGSVIIPANSGTDGGITPAVDLLGSSLIPWVRRDGNGRSYISIGSGGTLKAYVQSTVTSGKEIDIFAQDGAF